MENEDDEAEHAQEADNNDETNFIQNQEHNIEDETVFIERKLEELNIQEKNLLAQEQKLEKESADLLSRTKAFLN